MTSLQALQKNFQEYLIHSNSNSILKLTQNIQPLNNKRQLKIYFDAYRLRLLEILADDYPKLQQLMGVDAFESLSLRYIDSFPSEFFSVRYFGQKLSLFLQQTPEYQQYSYFAEMADFEWHLSAVLDAKDAPLVDAAILHTIPSEQWAQLKIQFHPSIQVLSFDWNTPTIWSKETKKPKKNIQPMTWLLWRKDLKAYFRSLTKSQALILDLFQKEYCFAEVCEALCDIVAEEKVPEEMLGFIQQCLLDKMISRLLT